MAFCTNCGRELIPGQICECQQGKIEENVTEQYVAAQQMYNVNVNGYFKIFSEVLFKPKSFGEKFVKEANVIKAFVFIFLQAILSGIFVAMKFGKINSIMESVVLNLKDSDDLIKLEMYKFPIFRDLIITIIASVALSCIIALVLWAMISIFRGRTTFANVINASAVSCIGKIPIILLAIIVSFLSVPISIDIYIMSAIIGICYYCMVITAGTGVNEDKNAIIAFIIALVSIICIYIYIRYFGEYYFASATHIAYSQIINDLKYYIKKNDGNYEIIYNMFQALKKLNVGQ